MSGRSIPVLLTLLKAGRGCGLALVGLGTVIYGDLNTAQASGPEVTQADVCAFQMTPPVGKTPGILVTRGFPADPDRWPGTLKLETSLKKKNGEVSPGDLCTVTVIGRHVVMTAAHCLHKSPCSGKLVTPDVTLSLDCEILSADRLRGAVPIDIALCKTTDEKKPIKLKGDSRFERLYDDTAESLIGKRLTILGYGCTGPFNTGIRGKLYYGYIKVRELDNKGLLRSDSILDPGTMALCSGDSGGGAFYYISQKRRRLVGINKKSNSTTQSWILSTDVKAIRAAIRGWAKSRRTKICGLRGELGEDDYICAE